MSNRLTDTALEAELVLRAIIRQMPFERKWQQMGAMYRMAKLLHAAGVRARNSGATVEEIHEAWMEKMLGKAILKELPRRPVNPNDENLPVVQEVIAALARLQIPYALGGSWASSLLGKLRFTHDADIAVESFPGKEAAFCGLFGNDYYLSLPAVQQAVQQHTSFNIIHTPSGFKVDVFVHRDRPFDRSVMLRRQSHVLGDPSAGQTVEFVSAEDIILLKLEWYRLGNETSEQQWLDVLGVFQVQGDRLDRTYLDHWAKELQIDDLLALARSDSGS